MFPSSSARSSDLVRLPVGLFNALIRACPISVGLVEVAVDIVQRLYKELFLNEGHYLVERGPLPAFKALPICELHAVNETIRGLEQATWPNVAGLSSSRTHFDTPYLTVISAYVNSSAIVSFQKSDAALELLIHALRAVSADLTGMKQLPRDWPSIHHVTLKLSTRGRATVKLK